MKLFIDSANIDEIRSVAELGLCDGVTTNPSLVAKNNLDFKQLLKEIVNIIPGAVSAEVLSLDSKEMIKEAEELTKIGSNIVIKLPLTKEGLKACKILSGRGIKTNVTLCFSVNQAMLAAKAGATYVSPFVGRLDDIGEMGTLLVQEIKKLFSIHHFETKILASSIRSVKHITEVSLVGVDAATLPFKIFEELYYHKLTEKGLEQFLEDWKKSDQKNIVF